MLKTLAIGRVGSDPELKYTKTGIGVATFSVAITQPGQDRESTTWVRCSAWRKQAEVCAQYLKKGTLVYVEGTLKARAWTGRDGNVRAELDMNLINIQFLSKARVEESSPDVSASATFGSAFLAPTPDASFTDSDIPF
jgi:single-strand DNA-binding protein